MASDAPLSPQEVVAALKSRGWILATAESCTGGMIAAAITDVPGSSAVLDRGFVTYSNAAKTEMLGISPDRIAAFGAVSEQVAESMARGALQFSQADIAVAVTGIAGPGGSEHKPEGRVCFGLATPGGVIVETVEFGPLGRPMVRMRSLEHAFTLIAQVANQSTPE